MAIGAARPPASSATATAVCPSEPPAHAADAALIGLARLLGRAAAREWLAATGADDDDGGPAAASRAASDPLPAPHASIRENPQP